MKKIVFALAFVCLSGASDLSAENNITEDDAFALYNGCEMLTMRIGIDGEKIASKIGLTRKTIQNAIESRLRSARLYSTKSSSLTSILVGVGVTERAFSIQFAFRKWLSDQIWGPTIGPATTWPTGSFGTHGSDPGYIVSAISRHMDQFLAEFLRVNQKACGKSS